MEEKVRGYRLSSGTRSWATHWVSHPDPVGSLGFEVLRQRSAPTGSEASFQLSYEGTQDLREGSPCTKRHA